MNATSPRPVSPDDEKRLASMGLSVELIHAAFRHGLSRAANRTSLALRSTPGTDIYHDAMEHLHLLLVETGWRLVYVRQQPRLQHPTRLFEFTVSSGRYVARDAYTPPRTGQKGPATRDSLCEPQVLMEPLLPLQDPPQSGDGYIPLWFLIHERTDRGLYLELSLPEAMSSSGMVNGWRDRIFIPFLDLDGDLSVFDRLPGDDFNVIVEPR